MKRYVTIDGANENELKKMHDDFNRLFSIDLNDKKYNSLQNIKEIWNAVITDIFGKEGLDEDIPDIEKFLSEFKIKKNFMKDLINNYAMYKDDIWMNAYFTIKYIDLKKYDDDAGTKLSYYENMDNDTMNRIPFSDGIRGKFCINYQKMFLGARNTIFETIRTKNGVENLNINWKKFIIEEVDKRSNISDEEKREIEEWDNLLNEFKKIYKKKGESIKDRKKREVREEKECELEEKLKKKWKSLTETEKEKIFLAKTGFDFEKDKDISRWDFKNLRKLEQSNKLKLEDKILFYKTINTTLVRKLLCSIDWKENIYYDTVDICRSLMNDKIIPQILYKINGIKPMKWKLLLSQSKFMLSFKTDIIREMCDYNNELVNAFIDQIYYLIKKTDEINNMSDILTNGLVYLYYNKFYNKRIEFENIEEEANKFISKLGECDEILSEEMEKFYKLHKEGKKIRVNSNEVNIGIVYVYLQRLIILLSKIQSEDCLE